MNWKNSRGEQLVFWRVGSFLDTSGNQTLIALRAKTRQTLVRSLGQSGTSVRTQCQPAIYKESSKYLRPTRDNVTDNRERKAGLRYACNGMKGWSREVSEKSKREWIKWSTQLKLVRVPKSTERGVGQVQAIHLHVFANARNTTGVVRGLLTSKFRTSKRAIYCETRTNERSDGGKHGPKSTKRPGAMAYGFHNRMYGQYGPPALDHQTGNTLESFRRKPSEKDGKKARH